MSHYQRRFPIGAEPAGGGRTHFRVWAPNARELEVAIEYGGDRTFHPLHREEGGYFSGEAPAGRGERTTGFGLIIVAKFTRIWRRVFSRTDRWDRLR